jgi:hypothetical protein
MIRTGAFAFYTMNLLLETLLHLKEVGPGIGEVISKPGLGKKDMGP